MSSNFAAVFPSNLPYPISKTMKREYSKFNGESLLALYLTPDSWILEVTYKKSQLRGFERARTTSSSDANNWYPVTDPNSWFFWTVETVKLQALLQVNHHSILKSQQIWDLQWKRTSIFFFRTGNLKLTNQACFSKKRKTILIPKSLSAVSAIWSYRHYNHCLTRFFSSYKLIKLISHTQIERKH